MLSTRGLNFSKSELVNNLTRQARKKKQLQIDLIRTKLDDAEKSGFTSDSKEQIIELSRNILLNN